MSTAQDAPLFHSTADEFREEDDEEERDRETADLHALQFSRRVFGVSRLDESLETEGSNDSIDESREEDGRALEDRGRGRGIKSSWNGGRRSAMKRGLPGPETVGEEEIEDDQGYRDRHGSDVSSGGGPARMVDVGLESTMAESEVPEDLMTERQLAGSPAPFQTFGRPRLETNHLQRQRDLEAARGISQPASVAQSVETVPPTVPVIIGEPPRHDQFWGHLYLISVFGMLASFFLVFLHTSAPGKNPLGDTIYTTLRSSFHLLGVDTVASIIVGLIWLALLRSFAKPLFYLLLVAVPVVLFSFSLYPFIESFNGSDSGSSVQSRVMRWFSIVPLILAVAWVFTAYKGRHAFSKAIGILEFSGRILAANSALLVLGFAALAVVVSFTWIWILMFTRVFLGGHRSGSLFLIDLTTWWTGVFFVLVYLWTLGMINGIQRATTAATVSQWYFHRNAEPGLTSPVIVQAAFLHSLTTIFGTVALSTFLALLVRLPLLILPRRLVGVLSIFAYSLIPTPIATLMSPLTLTYSAIRSQPLSPSARALSQMSFLGPQLPTTTLTPRSFGARNSAAPLLPYRLAKLLLHATRFIMAMALGFGGWVATARQLAISMPGSESSIRGSAYAYVVGLVAGAIGWGILGTIEGVLSGIVDACVVCWGIEKGTAGGGAYCLEAGYLFGEGRDRSELPR